MEFFAGATNWELRLLVEEWGFAVCWCGVRLFLRDLAGYEGLILGIRVFGEIFTAHWRRPTVVGTPIGAELLIGVFCWCHELRLAGVG